MFAKPRRRIGSDAFSETARSRRELAEKHHALTKEIASLEHFICDAPARAAERQLDRMQTIPPPEVFDGEPATANDAPVRLSRGQAARVRAGRRRNMFVFLIAALAFGAFAHWLSSAI